MIEFTFHRHSVCMGDDANNGKYRVKMPETSTLADLIHVIMKGGCGNTWPIPYTGGDSKWIVRSNIGDLAKVFTDHEGEWHVEYCEFSENTPLSKLGIEWVFGDHNV